MKNLIIIGARGFGREVFHLATQCKGYLSEFNVKGFLDDKSDALSGFNNYPPIINSVEDYVVQFGDVFVCALGDVRYKKKYVELILNKGGEFTSLIHPTAYIDSNSVIGKGGLVFHHTFVSCDIVIGEFVTLQPSCVIGHDAKIGNYCYLGAFSFLGGFVEIDNLVTLHTRSTVLPHKKVRSGATVGVGSVAIRNVPEGVTVFGNPAVRL